MDENLKERTAQVNGQLWGASARDWADIQEGQFRAGYLAALERAEVGSGSDYLDAGCGAGMAAEIAASRGANVSGLDASDELLVIARERVPAGRFELGDLEALPFEDDSFDVVTGFNAFQFAGNIGIALAEARRVTSPGGNVVILTWGDPEGMEAATLIGALKTLLPPPPPDAPGPFALSDEKKLRGIAEEAGLTPIDLVDGDTPFIYPDLATAIRGLASSGVAARARGLVGEDAVNSAFAKALAPFRQADDGYRIGAAYRFLVAQA